MVRPERRWRLIVYDDLKSHRWIYCRVYTAGWALAAGVWFASGAVFTAQADEAVDRSVLRPFAFSQAPVHAGPTGESDLSHTILSDRYVPGMRVLLADARDVAGTMRVMTPDFALATDPVFSFDGARLAFSGKRTRSEPLQIWETAVADATAPGDSPGTSPAQLLVPCEADCISPVSMSDGAIVVASLSSGEYEEHGGQYAFSLYSFDRLAEQFTRITFNPSSDFDPTVLPDGRILFSSWQHVGNHHWPRGTVALMLVNSDGTGVFPATGNHRGPWLKRGACPVGEDGIAFIQSDGGAPYGAGALVRVSINDLFGPYDVLIASDDYQVSGVASFRDGVLLVSARPTDGSRDTFGLYLYERGEVRLLFDDPGFHELAPAVGGIRPVPERRFSTVVPDTPYGYLAVLNCYETDRPVNHEPNGLRPGSVKSVRVIEGMPLRHDGALGPAFFSARGRDDEPMIRPNAATGVIPSRVLGEVPPASDGSVYLRVPADRPLRLQLVDQNGFAVMNERTWFWVRPNERRVCIGCHEHRELSPPNVRPLATLRTPTDLTDEGQSYTVSFRGDIEPIVRRTCAVSGCHVPPSPTAGMNLSPDRLNGSDDPLLADRFGPAYANLLARQEKKPFAVGGRRVHPGDARGSPLMWMLYGRRLGTPYKPAPFDRPMMTPHPGPMLPEAQLDLFRKWIDLGAPYDASAAPGPWPYEVPRVGSIVKVNGEHDDD